VNIGIVTTWFERGAAYVSRQFKELLDPHFQVKVYARGGESYAIGDPNWDGPQVTWGKAAAYGVTNAVDLADFRLWLERNNIHLVLFNEQWSWPPIILCNELGILTGAYVDYYTEETIPLFACYDFLICNTQRHVEAFDWHPQCWYIPWGTDLAIFKPQPTFPQTTNVVRFFHSCGMSPKRKGTDLVLEAFNQLEAPAELIVHSQRPLADLLPEQGQTISKLQSNGRLQIKEATVPAPGLYHLGDVYVYPSRLDGIGLTIAEAMACGLPVITTNYPPMNEFVRPGTNGLVVDVARVYARADGYYWPQSQVNLASLTQAMQYYVDNIADLAAYQIQARHHAEQHFDWRHNAQALIPRLNTVTKQSPQHLQTAGQRALAYERQRMNFLQRHPTLYRIYSALAKLSRRIYKG
jgi:glycosyltransferase involved in cell wall biosynthesis